jgi:NAD-dependent deacetylase
MDPIAAVADRLRTAQRVVALTGAGISSESGLPTFREAQTGLWARYSPEELATPEAFQRQPELVWRWYAWRRSLSASARPNAAHHALVTIEQRVPEFTLVTQNIDGLHERAGSRHVIELHGRIDRTRCSRDGTPCRDWGEGEPPPCPVCGAPLRPDVVWFGEPLPQGALEAAADAVDGCDVLLVVGTSLRVFPAAGLVPLGRAAGAYLVIIDIAATEASRHARELRLQGPAAVLLPAVVRAAWPD